MVRSTNCSFINWKFYYRFIPGADVIVYPIDTDAAASYLADWMRREVSPEEARRVRKFLDPQ